MIANKFILYNSNTGLAFQSPVLGTKEPCFTQEFGLAPAIGSYSRRCLYRLRVRFILVVIFASDLIISFIFTDEKDEVSRESIKKERDRKRYTEMSTQSRHEKIVRTNEGRRQKSNYLTGIYNVVLPVCLWAGYSIILRTIISSICVI